MVPDFEQDLLDGHRYFSQSKTTFYTAIALCTVIGCILLNYIYQHGNAHVRDYGQHCDLSAHLCNYTVI